ncbi:MAG: branched-chain amino acid ABC transporter permease, partial [Oscillospiraceae bacterium]|nr:branched-chain amino acid ABC transporter permease [Oscillospiraceae bacterium]
MKHLKPHTKQNLITIAGVLLAYVIVTALRGQGLLSRSAAGLLVPICCYVVMALSLNLTVGIMGELSLGHAGFMGVGAFSGIIAFLVISTLKSNGMLNRSQSGLLVPICCYIVMAVSLNLTVGI